MDEIITKQQAIDEVCEYCPYYYNENVIQGIADLPTIVKSYTKADYIMALHKEYGISLEMAAKAHDKALEYLRSKAKMKG